MRGFDHLPEGARYFRADLHMHTHGVSPDVRDSDMTVENIVSQAKERGIDLVAVTDHNAIDSVGPLIEVAAREELAVLAGVEISTTEGHLLVYFEPDELERFSEWFARIRFQKDVTTGDRWTLTPMHDIIADVVAEDGIAIPAHVGRVGSGFAVKAAVKAQDAIVVARGVVAVEVDTPDEFAWFSPDDSGPGSSERKRQLLAREKALNLPAGSQLARVRFSDAHHLDAIGRNRDGKERLTRIKMGVPSFEGFRTALLDSDARIRLEDELPKWYPRIDGARFVGGFLDQQEIRFSSNLTCLIGGRGTGKSTALESVRAACLNSEPNETDTPNLPQTLELIYADEFGEQHMLLRDAGGRTVEITSEGQVETSIPIDGYAQNRIAEITTSYGDDPLPLLRFLDAFASLDDIEERLTVLRGELEGNAKALAPQRDAPQRLGEGQRLLADTNTKLGAVERSKFRAAYEWKQKLEQERSLRNVVKDRLGELQRAVDDLTPGISLSALATAAGIPTLKNLPSREALVGANDEGGLAAALAALSEAVADWKRDGERLVSEHLNRVASLVTEWERRDAAVEQHFQEVVTELREQGIAPDLAAINRLLTQQAAAQGAIASATADQAQATKLQATRDGLLAEVRKLQNRRFYLRQQAMQRVTERLNRSLDEFSVKFAFEQGDLRAEYEVWLRAAIGNRFFRTDRFTGFCATVHPHDLATWARSGSVAKLLRFADAEGANYFASRHDAESFIAAVGAANLDELELVDTSDRPTIVVTTGVGDTPTTVPFENLSLGQKASVLLGALLFAEDRTPLIIDQPEDHLDSRFIFGTVVANLRHVKERRQVILATHNANIAILGDAEMIVPLQGWKGQGVIRQPGSVDAPQTRSRACDILEGGTSAYMRRGEMYGVLEPASRRTGSFGTRTPD